MPLFPIAVPYIFQGAGVLLRGTPVAMGVYQIYKTVKNFVPMSKKNQAEKIVVNHVYWSIGAGLIPLPILDIASVTAVQMDMLKQLTALYEIKFNEDQGKVLVTTLAGSTIAKLGASLIKAIPGIGSMLGGISMSAVSGASTYAVGQVFSKHFEQNGTLFDFDASAFTDYYKDMFEEGKEVAAKLEKEKQATKSTSETAKTAPNIADAHNKHEELILQLKNLSTLKDQGVITDTEFTALKDKIITSL